MNSLEGAIPREVLADGPQPGAAVSFMFVPGNAAPVFRLLHVVAALAVAAALVVATLIRCGAGWSGAVWSSVQIVLVTLAWIDFRQRRLPNVIVVPLGLCAVALRIAFQRDALPEILVAGSVTFAVFVLLALVVRGGLGMGDVKLAAAEGLLLGRVAVDALFLGVLLGGVAAILLVAARRAGRGTTYAYGPYLALGAALTILIQQPPPIT